MPQTPLILVAEDDAAMSAIIALNLQKRSFRVVTTENGEDALRVTIEKRPDLIISDWMMPKVDGLTFLHNVKSDPELRDVFFIMLTAKGQLEDKISALDTGADDYITKPFQHSELIARVRAGLRIVRMQNELKEKNAQLTDLSRLKDEFLGMAAHDMRTPLTGIKGATELLLGNYVGDITAEQRELIEIVERQGKAMLDLVNDLLDVAKIESGKVKLSIQPRDLGKLLATQVETNMVWARKKSIPLLAACEPGLPLVDCDEDRVGQVLNNLISNAIKFSPEGAKVTLSARRAGKVVNVQVSDNGQGIPEEEKEKLFKAFSQTSSRPTKGESGTGLGLAIVKKLVELHGGEVGVESTIGKGSTFWFTLPVSSAKSSPKGS